MPAQLKLPVIAGALIALHLALVAILAANVGWTADEPGYVLAGHAILEDFRWGSLQERLHGSLGLLSNQLFVDKVDPARIDSVRFAARCGALPFVLLLMFVIVRWSHDAWGRSGALLSLVLAAFSPTLLAYGPLVTVDIALAATTTLTLWLLWRWLQAPSLHGAAVWGAALGVAMSTKYLALIYAAAVPIVVMVAAVCSPKPCGRRVVASALALIVAAVAALLALHATYLFCAPLFDPAVAQLQSSTLQKVDAIPLLNLMLRALPAPLVTGADYQAAYSVNVHGRFLDYDSAHWAYYLTTIATKTALPILLAAVAGGWFALCHRRRGMLLCLAVPSALLLLYLTFLSDTHLGVRYVLPVYPLMLVLAGAFLHRDSAVGWPRRIAAPVLCAILVATTAWHWPLYLGYFNPVIGGPAGAYRVFTDSNTDWGENNLPGRERLRDRYPDIQFLRPADGPRFGRVCALTTTLAPPDSERPGRTYHWLRRFEPFDNYGAALLVFDIDAASFERAAQRGDTRAARDLSLAWIHAGQLSRATAAIDLVPAGEAQARMVELLELLQQIEDTPDAKPARRRAVEILYGMGRADFAFELIQSAGDAEQTELFLALWSSGDPEAAVALLRDQATERTLRPIEATMLAGGLLHLGEYAAALEVIENHPGPPAGDPILPMYRTLREQIEERHRALKRLQEIGQDR